MLDKERGITWAFDTETQDGKAILLTVAGMRDGVPNTAYLKWPGTFGSCVKWLSKWAPRMVAYNMDYDARSLIKFLPRETWKYLYRDEFVKWRGFKITYKPARSFGVTWEGGSFTLFDIAQQFQCSLAEASLKVLKRQGKKDIPKSWYTKMAAVLRNPKTAPILLEYAIADAETTRDLWLELSRQYLELGVPAEGLARPVSTGSISAAYFGELLKSPPLEWRDQSVARRAFAGGRIEILRRGYFPHLWYYDVKSAYPWVLSNLPDPRGLRVIERATHPDAVYSIQKVRVNIPRGEKIPPIAAWGKSAKGSAIRIYPVGSWVQWVTGAEVLALRKAGMLEDILDGIHLVGERRPWPLGIEKLFRERVKRPEISYAIKLVLNSCYGKTAQQDDGWRESGKLGPGTRSIAGKFMEKGNRFGTTTNFFVASYVTATMRMRLWEEMRQMAGNVVLIATDGVMLTKPFPKHLRTRAFDSGALGCWETAGEDLKGWIVGTGVYELENPRTGEVTTRARGYREIGRLRDRLNVARPYVTLKSRIAYTLGDAVTREVEMNKIEDITRTLDVNFDDKRAWPHSWKASRDILTLCQDSRPLVLLE